MRIRGRKVVAFFTTFVAMNTLYYVTLFATKGQGVVNYPLTIVLLLTNGVIFIGGNTLDKWLKTKFMTHKATEKVETPNGN